MKLHIFLIIAIFSIPGVSFAVAPTAAIVIPTTNQAVAQNTTVSFSGSGTAYSAPGVVVGTYTAGLGSYKSAFDSLTNSIWVTNYYGGSIQKFDVYTGNLTATYNLGSVYPYGIAFDTFTNSIWVIKWYVPAHIYKLEKIDVTNGNVVGSYYLPSALPSNAVNSIAFDPSTNSIWVSSAVGSVTKINPVNGNIIGTYTNGTANAIDMVFDSVSNSMWVTNPFYNNISKLNASNGSLISSYTFDTLSIGYISGNIAFDSFTNSIWLTNTEFNLLVKINAVDGAVVGVYNTMDVVYAGDFPAGLTFDPSTNSIWVNGSGSNDVTQFNPLTGAIMNIFQVGIAPTWGIIFEPATNSIWVNNHGGASITKIGTGGNSITAYEWRESNCSTGTLLSSASSFNLSTPTAGTRTIYLRVKDSQGTWSTNCPSRVVTVTSPTAAPTVTTPTVTSITTTGATLGANVVSLGNPATISARGTCWGTTPLPTTNCVAATGVTTGVFTQARTGLTANTTYYYRGYATNTTGTGYSTDGTFTTLVGNTSTAPTITGPATLVTGQSGTYSFVATDAQGNQVSYAIDWNGDGITDVWMPAGVAVPAPMTYVTSGTAQSVAHSWATAGTYSIKALTQDAPGLNSAWTSYTVTVTAPLACVSGAVTAWGPCTSSTTCTTPPSPAQLTNQTGTQSGICPQPQYTTNVVNQTCSTATINCTPGTSCGDNLCNGTETILTCPKDCKAKVIQF